MSALTPLRVRLPFRSEDEFVSQYGAHVGRDGFFLATRAPKPAGTRLLFELVLESGQPLLRGEGIVVRALSGQRPGMAVRFLRLDRAGQALVQRVVAGRTPAGEIPGVPESPGDAEEAPPGVRSGAVPTGEAHPAAWAAPSGPSVQTANGSNRQPAAAGPGAWVHPATPATPEPVPLAEPPPTREPDSTPQPTSAAEVGPAPEPTPAAEAVPGPEPTPAAEAAPEPEPTPAAEAVPASESTTESGLSPDELTPSIPHDELTETPRLAPHQAAKVAAEPGPVTGQPELDTPEEPTARTPTRPPLDEPEHPELVVSEFVGAGPRGPAGLQRAAGHADVHAAVTPHAGTPVVTDIDEPAVDRRFSLSAPVAGDEPIETSEASFADVSRALGPDAHERPTKPIPLLSPLESTEPEAVPLPPPYSPEPPAPLLDEDPLLGAIPLAPEPAARTVPDDLEAPIPLPAPRVMSSPLDTEVSNTSSASNISSADTSYARETVPPSGARSAPARAGATPTESPARAQVLGIDIGAESVRLAWIRDGRPEPLALDPRGTRPEFPLRLVREPGAAARVLPADAPEPASWVGAPLPFLGLRADSPLFRTVARRWPAVIVADERGEVAFALEGGTVSALELTATLLRWLRQRAEESMGGPVSHTILAVPVSYTAVQRGRLREAAARAGFEGVRLIHAPTAAAMAFVHGRGLARRRILVWRMGATAFDVAVLAVSGNDLDMVACAGDPSLGGMNFDEQIALAMDKSARADPALLRKRVAEADQLKRLLDDPALPEAALEGGAHLSRLELEARTSALVERGVLLTREVLRSASLGPDNLDELLLVGGTTRLPHVRRMVEEAVGRTGRTDVDGGGAVALGAAMVGHLLASVGPKSASQTAVHEVLGVPLEAVSPEMGQIRVLERNTRLPAEKTLTLNLAIGTPLEIQMFQGPGRAPDPRSFLGLLRAGADRAGDWTLHFSVDTNGILQASATAPSGQRQMLALEMPATPAEPEAAPRPPGPETTPPPPEAPGLLGGLKKLFGRR
jgi:molecular chaperone DnaK